MSLCFGVGTWPWCWGTRQTRCQRGASGPCVPQDTRALRYRPHSAPPRVFSERPSLSPGSPALPDQGVEVAPYKTGFEDLNSHTAEWLSPWAPGVCH